MTYNETTRIAVWVKATPHAQLPATEWRIDSSGNLIRWRDYGNRNSQWGWEIDHVFPNSMLGLSAFSNLQALHWKANAQKSARPPSLADVLAGLLPPK